MRKLSEGKRSPKAPLKSARLVITQKTPAESGQIQRGF